MNTTTLSPVLTIRRLFDAAPDAVFDAWLEREQWQAWIGPEGCHCDVPVLDARVGGRYQLLMRWSDGREIPVEGVFKTIERPRKLSFTWGWALSGKADTLVSLDFRAVGGQTELTLIHEGLPTPEDREGHGKGWNSTLNKLARYVKGEAV
jgi:uncharacterized protein YndB with AHSA1/START domain